MTTRFLKFSAFLVLSSLASTVSSRAEQQTVRCHTEPRSVDSGRHDNHSVETVTPFRDVVRAEGAPWLRLHFGAAELGKNSRLILTSLRDGARQILNAAGLTAGGSWSAFFNGDAVQVELEVAPGETGVSIQLLELTTGEPLPAPQPGFSAAVSGCPDPRLPITDARVGRLSYMLGPSTLAVCTAWLASNGSLISAGHCMDDDPDGTGPQLPDGVLDINATAVVEFNVPLSRSDGSLVSSKPADQYPVDLSSIRWEFPGYVATLVGGDWAVFACRANSSTKLKPHQAQQGFFRLTNLAPFPPPPPFFEKVRITGYGADSVPVGSTGSENAFSYTLQTAVANYIGEFNILPALWPIPLPIGNYHYYDLDSRGGSSGSPLIWESTGFAIGINVAGDCSLGAVATSTEHDPLELALQRFPGPNTVYVDAVPYPQFFPVTIKNGTIYYPHDKVSDAVDHATTGATLSIVTGTYHEALHINKELTITAPVGPVTIGP